MEKGDTIYLHLLNMDNGAFSTYQATIKEIDSANIIHTRCILKNECGRTKVRFSHFPMAAIDMVGECKTNKELEVFSYKNNPTEAKKTMAEFLQKRKDKLDSEAQSFGDLIAILKIS